MNRTILLILTLIAASGVWVAHHWAELRITMGVDESADQQAIELAKEAYCVERLRTNDEAITDHMAGLDDPDVTGWVSESQSDRIHLVRFLYTEGGVPDGYWFEVDLADCKVRNLAELPELAKKYGVPVSPQ